MESYVVDRLGPGPGASGGEAMAEYRLERFVSAQDRERTFELALEELRSARKQTHWMWFVFPQIAGLGQSAMSRRFSISGLGEAQAYLAHETLGPRLRECCRTLLALEGVSAPDVFGYLDAVEAPILDDAVHAGRTRGVLVWCGSGSIL